MDKKIYTVNVNGCDDYTTFNVVLTQDEYNTVKMIADKCTKASTYGCMPTMDIYLYDDNSPT